MRIGVIGAGAIGGMLAALLDRAGHEVVVTARGANLDAIRAHGLALDGAYGTHLARVGAAQVLPAPPELAIVAVKAQDAEDAARANLAALDGVPTVVVQNGLRGAAALSPLLPSSPLVGALSMIAATHLEPGRVTVTAAAETVLGAATAGAERTAETATVLGAAVPVRVVADLEAAQWSKLVVNQLNAAPAVTGLPAQQALADADLRRAIATAMRETIDVARAHGIAPAGVLPAAATAALGSLPPRLGAAVVGRMVAAMGAVPNPGSTLQSIRRGRPTEVDELSGAVVREGVGVDVPTPVNARIVDLVHEVEASGAFLSPAEAADRLLGRSLSRRPRTPGSGERDR